MNMLAKSKQDGMVRPVRARPDRPDHARTLKPFRSWLRCSVYLCLRCAGQFPGSLRCWYWPGLLAWPGIRRQRPARFAEHGPGRRTHRSERLQADDTEEGTRIVAELEIAPRT